MNLHPCKTARFFLCRSQTEANQEHNTCKPQTLRVGFRDGSEFSCTRHPISAANQVTIQSWLQPQSQSYMIPTSQLEKNCLCLLDHYKIHPSWQQTIWMRINIPSSHMNMHRIGALGTSLFMSIHLKHVQITIQIVKLLKKIVISKKCIMLLIFLCYNFQVYARGHNYGALTYNKTTPTCLVCTHDQMGTYGHTRAPRY